MMKIVSPIAIDMGAKNTGVYYAKYRRGASFEDIEKKGEVLVYEKYTPLLRDRTAKRHARRGYQRRKLAKRLVTLILENYFNFPAKQHVQAIGFLLNRRGFTFLDEEYSKEHLDNMPDGVWAELSDETRRVLKSSESVSANLKKIIEDEPDKITAVYKAIRETAGYEDCKKMKRNLFYYGYVKKIANGCEKILQGEDVKEKKMERHRLSKTSKWIVVELVKDGIEFPSDITESKTNSVNLLDYMNSIDDGKLEHLKENLPDIFQSEKDTKNSLKNSMWDFNFEDFSIDKHEEKLFEGDVKTHLHNFCYAIHKIKHELDSGSRHRSKFFQEIEDDLKKIMHPDYKRDKNSPKYLVEFAKEIELQPEMNDRILHKLVCHISNFELRPLRAYFNDKTPIKKQKCNKRMTQGNIVSSAGDNFILHSTQSGGDKFSNIKLSRIAARWFMENWVVNEEKDGDEKVAIYRELRESWGRHSEKNNVIKFWLKTKPVLTIPPYQSMTNRRPPKCQSLLLNCDYLESNYPNWGGWLTKLTALQPCDDYQEKLESLQRRKGKSRKHDGKLIRDKFIRARQLQFILDTTKKLDKFKLNEIWSIHHRLQKIGADQEWQSSLESTISGSALPNGMKDDLRFTKPSSFGYFLNEYYQARKRARDGRYFLHQMKKDQWATTNKMLTVCHHKPRQKNQQWLIDLASVVGEDYFVLGELIGHKLGQAQRWFDVQFGDGGKKNALEKICIRSAKAQKDYRGALRAKIGFAKKEMERIKGTNKKLNNEDKILVKLTSECEEIASRLAKKLWTKLSEDELKEKAERFDSVFSFSQINSIVFQDRSGFSSTCPVCSIDNGFRMRTVKKETESVALASRLPAISIRLIDGLVMRVCDAVSRHVASTCWNSVKSDLEKGKSISIPLIFEQNRFEFEPSLSKLKIRNHKDQKDDRAKHYNEKEQRIKQASQGICAYTGVPLGSGGEIDHIVPRASKYGTINDEANLIYVSNTGNQGKSNQTLFLRDLKTEYKKTIFDGKSDEEIERFICRQLEGVDEMDSIEEGDPFLFGRYFSFINLTAEQQRAFRHALFLDDGNKLKQKVIHALQNRNRAIVNGTQRYMAQCIADKIHRIARASGYEKRIEFDYFEYPTTATHPSSVFLLRKFYEDKKAKLANGNLLSTIAKNPNEKQKRESHLIDAQMAFLLAADEHKNDGSMGLHFDEHETVTQGNVNIETGEFDANKFFNLSRISAKSISNVSLNRSGSETGVRLHRSFHRPNFYAENYVPMFVGKKGEEIQCRAGFSWNNSAIMPPSKGNRKHLMSIMRFAKDGFISTWAGADRTLENLHCQYRKKTIHDGFEVFYIDWDKTRIQKYLVDEFSNKDVASGKQWSGEIVFLRKNLSYRTRRQDIDKYATIEEIINKGFEIKIFNQCVELPVKQDWENLSIAFKKTKPSNENFQKFLKDYFEKGKRNAGQKNRHQKVRRVFSLPVVNSDGHFLQRRRSWNGRDIYQICSDSDSRLDGNKFSRKVVTHDGELKEAVNDCFVSKNSFKLKQIEKKDLATESNYDNIPPTKWIKISEENDDFPHGVLSIEYRIDNVTRPSVKITVADNLSESDIDGISECSLTKAKDNAGLKEMLTSGDIQKNYEYTGSGFNKDVKGKLQAAMKS